MDDKTAEVLVCEIRENSRLTNTALAMTIICGPIACIARAGQFIYVRCGDDLLLRRPFGVSNIDGDMLTFVYEVKGAGTRKLSGLKRGDRLDVMGPLGNGFGLLDGNIVIVGGGLGSPPMLYAAKSVRGAVTAVLGFRDSGRVMLVDEFKNICEKVIITTDDGSYGVSGNVAQPLEELLIGGGHTTGGGYGKECRYNAVLACGQLAMQRAVAEICEKYNVPCRVSLEERMGCGVGACLVCACETVKNGFTGMSRVCRDGPVFDAREVVW